MYTQCAIKKPIIVLSNNGQSRDDWIRTSDPLHPMQVRYRAALRPENPDKGCKSMKKSLSCRIIHPNNINEKNNT
jgi:hypothetical protein